MFPKSDLSFTPKSIEGAGKPKYENQKCYALKPEIDYNRKAINLEYLIKSNALLKGKDFITKKSFFKKLSGTDLLYNQIVSGMSEDEIRKTWEEGLRKYNRIRSHYVLYN